MYSCARRAAAWASTRSSCEASASVNDMRNAGTDLSLWLRSAYERARQKSTRATSGVKPTLRASSTRPSARAAAPEDLPTAYVAITDASRTSIASTFAAVSGSRGRGVGARSAATSEHGSRGDSDLAACAASFTVSASACRRRSTSAPTSRQRPS